MDSTKASTGTFYLTVVIVILTVILVFLGLAVWLYPNPKLPTLPGGILIKAFLGICILVVVGLQVLVAFLIRGRLRKRVAELESQLEPKDRTSTQPVAVAPFVEPKLTFEIDTEASQVRVGDGNTEIRAIFVDIKLRCFKGTNSVAAVRAFHISLHRTWPGGDEVTVIAQEDSQKVTEFPDGPAVSTGETWTITGPDTDYRVYRFTLQVTPKVQFSLSPNHVLRVTMAAVGQAPISQTVYVNDWELPISGISLKPLEEFPLAAKKEISRLKQTLASYEKTNEDLGRFHERYNWLTKLADKQKAEIDDWVAVQRCERGDLILDPPRSTPCKVVLSIWVTNKSVLDISLSNELGGFIKFEGTKLLDAKEVTNPVTDVPSGETRCLTVEQRLTPSDVQAIRNAGVRPQFFNLEKLEVKILGGKRSPDITPKPLIIISPADAFPLNLLERGQRIRTLSEIRGRCVQLFEPFRQGSHEPLPKDSLEHWVDSSLEALKRVYKPAEVKAVWKDINSDPTPDPTSGVAQEIWLESCVVNLGEMIVRDAGEYSKYLIP